MKQVRTQQPSIDIVPGGDRLARWKQENPTKHAVIVETEHTSIPSFVSPIEDMTDFGGYEMLENSKKYTGRERQKVLIIDKEVYEARQKMQVAAAMETITPRKSKDPVTGGVDTFGKAGSALSLDDLAKIDQKPFGGFESRGTSGDDAIQKGAIR